LRPQYTAIATTSEKKIKILQATVGLQLLSSRQRHPMLCSPRGLKRYDLRMNGGHFQNYLRTICSPTGPPETPQLPRKSGQFQPERRREPYVNMLLQQRILCNLSGGNRSRDVIQGDGRGTTPT